MNLIIFDDNKRENFFPLTLTRSTADLRVGILKLRQRITAYFSVEDPALVISSDFEYLYKERHPNKKVNEVSTGENLFVNSRIKIDEKFVKECNEMEPGSCFTINGAVVAAKIHCEETEKKTSETLGFSKLTNVEKSYETWNYLWDFTDKNAEMIQQDFEDFFYEKDNYFETEPGVHILNPYNVWIGEGAQMDPGVVIDARDGAVVIDEGAKIMANSVIIGPAYIGKKSTIKVGAKIYEGTSIGPVCKVGGEVEETILQAYSNKQHDGFLGHSYLGEWVNLGADTNNSDLKNNYKNVSLYFYPEKAKKNSGSQFVGTFIGDHSKTGINSTINTGTVIGCACNLFGRDLITDYVPSFSWGTGAETSEYKPQKFFETAEVVKKRRKLNFTETEEKLFEKIHKAECR